MSQLLLHMGILKLFMLASINYILDILDTFWVIYILISLHRVFRKVFRKLLMCATFDSWHILRFCKILQNYVMAFSNLKILVLWKLQKLNFYSVPYSLWLHSVKAYIYAKKRNIKCFTSVRVELIVIFIFKIWDSEAFSWSLFKFSSDHSIKVKIPSRLWDKQFKESLQRRKIF